MANVKRRDITVRGTVYPDTVAAARALGVKTKTIREAMRAGRLDRVGLGAGTPVRVRSVTYPTARAAAADLGVTSGAIYQALYRSGHCDGVGRDRRGSARAQPFEIAGLRYPSKSAASRALGFSRYYISEALRRDNAVMQRNIVLAAMREVARRDMARPEGRTA
ncbi:hypothetical protein EMVG_00054 [Emiliania huxleyi virus PS401]|nr:hypothetical protein EMVG_00054 [Emiliania huxleyi virus PS401]